MCVCVFVCMCVCVCVCVCEYPLDFAVICLVFIQSTDRLTENDISFTLHERWSLEKDGRIWCNGFCLSAKDYVPKIH